MLVLWGLSTMISRLSTTTSFVDSSEGGAMTAARLRLASVLVVAARWSTDLDVIFISGVRCIAMIEDEYIGSFPAKNKKICTTTAQNITVIYLACSRSIYVHVCT